MNEKLGDNIPQPRRRPWQNPRAMQIQRPLFPPSIIQRISKIDNLRTIQIQNFKSIMNETLELRTGTFLSGLIQLEKVALHMLCCLYYSG